MRAARAATAGLLSALVLPVVAAPALAAEDPVTGYWTRTNVAAPVPVQPPTPVPEGGFWVSNDPTGPVAVSAIRAGADEGNVVAALKLTIADSLGTPKILACPTIERWAPDRGGRLEGAPQADCTAALETVVEGETLLVTLPALLQTDVVDLLLKPAEGSTFSTTFERATAASIVQAPALTQSGPAPAPPPPPPATGGGSAPAGSGFESGGFSGGSDFGSLDLGAPGTAPEPLLPAPALPEPAPAEAAVPQPQAAPPAAAPRAVLATRPAIPPVDRTASLLAVALLAGLGALAVRLAVQPVSAPRHLGGGARLSRPDAVAPAEAAVAVASVVSPERGVGRFRSARMRPPVRI